VRAAAAGSRPANTAALTIAREKRCSASALRSIVAGEAA